MLKLGEHFLHTTRKDDVKRKKKRKVTEDMKRKLVIPYGLLLLIRNVNCVTDGLNRMHSKRKKEKAA